MSLIELLLSKKKKNNLKNFLNFSMDIYKNNIKEFKISPLIHRLCEIFNVYTYIEFSNLSEYSFFSKKEFEHLFYKIFSKTNNLRYCLWQS